MQCSLCETEGKEVEYKGYKLILCERHYEAINDGGTFIRVAQATYHLSEWNQRLPSIEIFPIIEAVKSPKIREKIPFYRKMEFRKRKRR